jgi:hypothetical protein
MTDIQLILIGLGFCAVAGVVGLHIESPYSKQGTVAYSIILGFCSTVFFYVALFS